MTNWDPNLETGHRQIDEDHREILRRFVSLKDAIDGGAGRERTVEMITLLHDYVLGHFDREEAYMLCVHCPAHGNNCTAHGEFARKLEGWIDLLTMSGTPVSMLLDVHREASAWIVSHILSIDCQLRDYPPQ
jgi:hemerythrin